MNGIFLTKKFEYEGARLKDLSLKLLDATICNSSSDSLRRCVCLFFIDFGMLFPEIPKIVTGYNRRDVGTRRGYALGDAIHACQLHGKSRQN